MGMYIVRISNVVQCIYIYNIIEPEFLGYMSPKQIDDFHAGKTRALFKIAPVPPGINGGGTFHPFMDDFNIYPLVMTNIAMENPS